MSSHDTEAEKIEYDNFKHEVIRELRMNQRPMLYTEFKCGSALRIGKLAEKFPMTFSVQRACVKGSTRLVLSLHPHLARYEPNWSYDLGDMPLVVSKQCA